MLAIFVRRSAAWKEDLSDQAILYITVNTRASLVGPGDQVSSILSHCTDEQ